MAADFFDSLDDAPVDRALFAQERAILEVTELICRLMKEQQVSKSELSKRLGKSKAYVTQLLDGRTNMTIRTISDVLHALGKSLLADVSDTSRDRVSEARPHTDSKARQQSWQPIQVSLIRTENLVCKQGSRSAADKLRLIA